MEKMCWQPHLSIFLSSTWLLTTSDCSHETQAHPNKIFSFISWTNSLCVFSYGKILDCLSYFGSMMTENHRGQESWRRREIEKLTGEAGGGGTRIGLRRREGTMIVPVKMSSIEKTKASLFSTPLSSLIQLRHNKDPLGRMLLIQLLLLNTGYVLVRNHKPGKGSSPSVQQGKVQKEAQCTFQVLQESASPLLKGPCKCVGLDYKNSNVTGRDWC